MKSKPLYWFVTSLYVLLVGATTIFTTTYSEAEKVVSFLYDQKTELVADQRKLLVATSIANTHDGTDAYVKKDPLYGAHYETTGSSLDLSFYALAQVKGSSSTDCLAILVSNFTVTDEASALNSDDYHILDATIEFTSTVTFQSRSSDAFTESFVTLFDDTSKLILIQYSRLTSSVPIEFAAITLSYPLTGGLSQTIATVEPAGLVALSPENIGISLIYAETYETSPSIYYDAVLLSRLSSYNYLYVKNLGIELLIVGVITYFIFFHKHVREKIKTKKALKKKENALVSVTPKPEKLEEKKESTE